MAVVVAEAAAPQLSRKKRRKGRTAADEQVDFSSKPRARAKNEEFRSTTDGGQRADAEVSRLSLVWREQGLENLRIFGSPASEPHHLMHSVAWFTDFR